MSNTLLIWEMIPESHGLYLIPNAELEKDDRLALVTMAHNKFVNCHESNRGMDFLVAALTDEEHVNDDSYFDDGYTSERRGANIVRVKTHEATPKEWRCIFDKYKVDPDVVLDNVNITRVVMSGFML